MIGVAILGAGNIANNHITSYLQFPERCKIIAIADIYTEKAIEKAKKYNLDCEITADYHTLLDRSDIDLVSVSLPPAMHCAVVVDFLKAGKHVLCEKPMAPTLQECDLMLAAARESGKKLSIVAQNRFKQDVMKTKLLLDSSDVGKILFAQANSSWWRGSRYYDLWWRGTWEIEGGGCTFIHAVHHIDLLLWYMGDVSEVSSFVANQNHGNSEVEDVSITTIKFKSGAIGTLTASLLNHGEEQSIVVNCERASVSIPHRINVSRELLNGFPEPDTDIQNTLESIYSSFQVLNYTEHTGQIENMLTAIEKNVSPLIDGYSGRRTIEFICAVYQSAFTNKPVQLPMSEKDLFYTKAGILSKAIKFNNKTNSVENFADIGISVGGSL